jgi:uncharacterized GH25 family protein
MRGMHRVNGVGRPRGCRDIGSIATVKNNNMTTSKIAFAFVGALVLCSGSATAHELFLKSEHAVASPGTHQIKLLNGSFDKSENSVARDRMRDVSIIANGKTIHPPHSAWSDDETKTTSMLEYEAGAPGTYLIGVSTKPKVITLPAKEWADYLKHDGVPDTLAVFEKQNRLENVRERYSKHVRAIVQVGEKKTTDYATPLGYPVEILLEQNPYELKQGQEMSFRVLFAGKPVANQFVKVSYEGHHGHDKSGNHVAAHQLRTDKDGRARFAVDKKSVWYVSLIHMQQIKDAEADYESNWATVTFGVQ